MNEVIFFSNCATFLQQGDIFAVNLVGPYADYEIRIFRTNSGLHGYKVLSEEEDGRAFSYGDLLSTLKELPLAQQVPPFTQNNEGLHEMVIVYGELLDAFIVASQTCDISGVDSTPKPFASVLPIVTLAGYFSRQKLPIGLPPEEYTDFDKWDTILNYLLKKFPGKLEEISNDPFILPGKVRDILQTWQPPKNSKDREIKNKIKEIINSLSDQRKLYAYYLPACVEMKIPEGFIDFCGLYTMPIETLQELLPRRIGTISTPYREHFATQLANYLSRIALPFPISSPKI